MSTVEQIKVPDIGDFQDVDVIEVLVATGTAVNIDDALITLESDKASMDIPTTVSGTVTEVLVKVGDKVSAGTPIATVETAGEARVADQEPQPTVHGSASASPALAATAPICIAIAFACMRRASSAFWSTRA